jgi:hypothetical protein
LSATLIVCSSSAPSAAPTTLPLPPKIAHPADDDGGDDLQLQAGGGGRVDRVVLRRPQHAAQAGDRAAEHERAEHPPGDRDPGQAGGVRV